MLPQNLQSLSPDTPIELFELSGYRISNRTEIIRICNYPGVFYRVTPTSQPHEYLAIGTEAGGYEINGLGALPQPTITVSNVGGLLESWFDAIVKDPDYVIEGAIAIRRIVQINVLEGAPDNLSQVREIQVDEFEIEQVAEKTNTYIKFLISSPIDLEGDHSGRIALRTCPWRYRDLDTCGYVGTSMFTREGNSTSDPKKDICPGTVSACELRFPPPLSLRHGGIPGLGGL